MAMPYMVRPSLAFLNPVQNEGLGSIPIVCDGGGNWGGVSLHADRTARAHYYSGFRSPLPLFFHLSERLYNNPAYWPLLELWPLSSLSSAYLRGWSCATVSSISITVGLSPSVADTVVYESWCSPRYANEFFSIPNRDPQSDDLSWSHHLQHCTLIIYFLSRVIAWLCQWARFVHSLMTRVVPSRILAVVLALINWPTRNPFVSAIQRFICSH